MPAEYVCNSHNGHIREMDSRGNWSEFFPGDDYTGPNAEHHLKGDPNTGPTISKKTPDTPVLPAVPASKEN